MTGVFLTLVRNPNFWPKIPPVFARWFRQNPFLYSLEIFNFYRPYKVPSAHQVTLLQPAWFWRNWPLRDTHFFQPSKVGVRKKFFLFTDPISILTIVVAIVGDPSTTMNIQKVTLDFFSKIRKIGLIIPKISVF